MAAFTTMEEAEQRARDQVRDKAWINAHGQRNTIGAISVRFQVPMSPTAPHEGAWTETTDNGAGH